MKFEWDENKNQYNIKKHGISFENAISVFEDPNALLIDDEEHSKEEERFIIMGLNENANLLVVCHCYREKEIIRLISARRANKKETKLYVGR